MTRHGSNVITNCDTISTKNVQRRMLKTPELHLC
ncbi:hypothetical protein Patl1_05123 [Pistacia atlantica]|uniref:Uncharacterized protein n=1 Tax=Pistacia atlantica TaxID=434234 RepID=A0ACC1BT95_9ROSI|nr:hypothetical protein Patl1_05123 [Pistacia atlantica]